MDSDRSIAFATYLDRENGAGTVGSDLYALLSIEYANVREFYDKTGISDMTSREFINGPHTIHGVGTFQFLHQHLRWAG